MSLLAQHGRLLSGSGGGDPWTPADLVAPAKLWVDWESSISTIGGAIASLSNRGSLGGSFTAADVNRRPTPMPAEINGKRAISFDGSDLLNITTDAARDLMRNVTAGWIFAVYACLATSVDTDVLFIVPTPASGAALRFCLRSGGTVYPNRPQLLARRLDADSGTAINDSTDRGTSWIIVRAHVNWSTGAADLYVNGGLVASDPSMVSTGSTSDTRSSTGIGIGGNASQTSMADVKLAALLSGAGASMPSNAEFQRLEGWAAWELGLQGNLPSGHPYKSAPPYA